MQVKDDIGYIKPISYQPVPVQTKPKMVENASKQTQSWWDKVVQYGSQLFTGLYTGAMAGLDIYERYKMIEKGQQTQSWSEVAKTGPGPGQVVILGQAIDKNLLLIIASVIVLIIILAVFFRK